MNNFDCRIYVLTEFEIDRINLSPQNQFFKINV